MTQQVPAVTGSEVVVVGDTDKRFSLETIGARPEATGSPEPDACAIDESTETGITLDEAEKEAIREQAISVLQSCYDPELPVNVYELGLIYNLAVEANGLIRVDMTLTSPGCPVAGALPAEIRTRLRDVPGAVDARVTLVWDPPWTQDRMSESARLELGLFS